MAWEHSAGVAQKGAGCRNPPARPQQTTCPRMHHMVAGCQGANAEQPARPGVSWGARHAAHRPLPQGHRKADAELWGRSLGWGDQVIEVALLPRSPRSALPLPQEPPPQARTAGDVPLTMAHPLRLALRPPSACRPPVRRRLPPPCAGGRGPAAAAGASCSARPPRLAGRVTSSACSLAPGRWVRAIVQRGSDRSPGKQGRAAPQPAVGKG